ncbi:MAG: PAS domain S-box protein [Breznakibacter sp.]
MEDQKKDNYILFVDPEQENLDLCKLLFKKHYPVLTADSPGEAMQILGSHDVKVILAEQYQREKTAIDLFKTTSEHFPRTERILMTGSIDKQVIIDAINIGKIFHHVTKPFEQNNLKSIIDKAIEKHNLQKQNDILILGLKQTNKELEYLLNRLKTEEEKFRDIFNATQDPILIVRKNATIIEANQLAQETFGFKKSDLGNTSFSALVLHDHTKKMQRFLMMLQLSETALFELMIRTAQGNAKSFETKGHAIHFQGEDALLLILRDTTERKETEKRVLQAIIQTEESERRRFAQELHDGVGPLLSTAKLYLQWILKPNAKIDKEVALKKIEETLEETIASIRELSNNLSPNTLVNFGLEAAIGSILERISGISEIDGKLTVDIENRLPFDLEATIFRIVGESINNTVKHANASRININIAHRNGTGLVEYQDNGCGFDVEKQTQHPTGNGLSNIRNRVMSLGGEIEIVSKPQQGFKLTCRFSI